MGETSGLPDFVDVDVEVDAEAEVEVGLHSR